MAIAFGSLTILRNYDYRFPLGDGTDTAAKTGNARAFLGDGQRARGRGTSRRSRRPIPRSVALGTKTRAGSFRSGTRSTWNLKHFYPPTEIDLAEEVGVGATPPLPPQ